MRCGAGDERRIHVNEVRGEVECDKELEDRGPVWISRGEEDQQTGGRASTSVLDWGRTTVTIATCLSVTMSSTPPSFEVWLKALAAIPSATSRIALMQ